LRYDRESNWILIKEIKLLFDIDFGYKKKIDLGIKEFLSMRGIPLKCYLAFNLLERIDLGLRFFLISCFLVF
jgi:hypothetical protein